ncbi:SCO6880 family protein [Corynebacterium sp. CCM 9203]|uniref:SCO6880 family protein n=1 Tax=Corynebacterium sp. CCM 9203 TaxID=3057615 RepID=UPI0035266C27
MSKGTYGNWVKPRSAGLYGMTFGTTIIMVFTFVTCILVMTLFGPVIGGPFFLLAAVLLAPLILRVGGRSGYERLAIMMRFFAAGRRGEHTYRAGRFSRVPGGSYRLPGIASRLELYSTPTPGLGDFALGHDKRKGFYTMWLRCFPSGGEAIEQHDIDFMVSQWGAFLTDCCSIADLIQVAVTHESRPESGLRLQSEAQRISAGGDVELARHIVHEAAAILPPVSARLDSRVALTFKASTAETRKDPSAAAVEFARFLPQLMTRLAQAGVTSTLMTPSEVCGFVHAAYDPESEALIEQAVLDETDHGFTWSNAGPQSAVETRNDYVHDGYRSSVFEMQDAPAGVVSEMVLKPLIAIDGNIPRKRVTMVFRPHSSSEAIAISDDDFRNTLFKARARGGIGSVSDDLAATAAGQTRQEIANGYGLVRFGVYATVTHIDGDGSELARQESVIQQRARQCGVLLRRCRHWQAAAFAGGLGIGIVLPEETTISNVLR